VTGAYHFFRPKVAVATQVRLFLSKVQALEPGELPPVLDLEVPEDWVGIAKADRIAVVLEWLGEVEAALGAEPFVYASPSFVTSVLGGSAALGKYLLWLANYNLQPKIPSPWSDWTFWQYTETGSVDGVTGHVDLDLFNGTRDDLNALVVKPPEAAAAPMPVAPVERTHIVIANADPIAAIAHAHTLIEHHLRDVGYDPARRAALDEARAHLERALGSVVPRAAPRRKRAGKAKARKTARAARPARTAKRAKRGARAQSRARKAAARRKR
jgi:hypothetical protein